MDTAFFLLNIVKLFGQVVCFVYFCRKFKNMFWCTDEMEEFFRSWEEEKNEVRKKYFEEHDIPFIIEKNINGMPLIVVNDKFIISHS